MNTELYTVVFAGEVNDVKVWKIDGFFGKLKDGDDDLVFRDVKKAQRICDELNKIYS